ncbi:MAG: hypothetical protein WC465_02215 [Patescibacteria group bacterium]
MITNALQTPKLQSFKMVIKPGDSKLRSGDYWAILVLCLVGSITLIVMMTQAI